MRALVERPHLVGPDSRRVDDGASAHRGLVAARADTRADDTASLMLEGDDLGIVQRNRSVRDGGARDREREPCIVGVRVVVEVTAGQAVAVESGESGERVVDA